MNLQSTPSSVPSVLRTLPRTMYFSLSLHISPCCYLPLPEPTRASWARPHRFHSCLLHATFYTTPWATWRSKITLPSSLSHALTCTQNLHYVSWRSPIWFSGPSLCSPCWDGGSINHGRYRKQNEGNPLAAVGANLLEAAEALGSMCLQSKLSWGSCTGEKNYTSTYKTQFLSMPHVDFGITYLRVDKTPCPWGLHSSEGGHQINKQTNAQIRSFS